METSLAFPVKKSRKRSSSSGRKSEVSKLDSVVMGASFVTGRRPKHSKKAKHGSAQTDDVSPALVITLEHRVAVIGKRSSDQGVGLQESSMLEYASRPGAATAFLPNATPTKAKKVSIRAVFVNL